MVNFCWRVWREEEELSRCVQHLKTFAARYRADGRNIWRRRDARFFSFSFQLSIMYLSGNLSLAGKKLLQ